MTPEYRQSWVVRRQARRPALWTIVLAALPLGLCAGVTAFLNICGG